MFIKLYNDFIAKHKKNNVENGFSFSNKMKDRRLKQKLNLQIHHIVPKCVDGANSLDNYVYLNDTDHKFAHLLLGLAYIEQHKKLEDIKDVSSMRLYDGVYLNKLFNEYPEVKSAIRFVITTIDKVDISMTFNEAMNMVAILKGYSPFAPKNQIRSLETLFKSVYNNNCGNGTIHGRNISIEWKRKRKFIRMN